MFSIRHSQKQAPWFSRHSATIADWREGCCTLQMGQPNGSGRGGSSPFAAASQPVAIRVTEGGIVPSRPTDQAKAGTRLVCGKADL
jgi:hypothetical protein